MGGSPFLLRVGVNAWTVSIALTAAFTIGSLGGDTGTQEEEEESVKKKGQGLYLQHM